MEGVKTIKPKRRTDALVYHYRGDLGKDMYGIAERFEDQRMLDFESEIDKRVQFVLQRLGID